MRIEAGGRHKVLSGRDNPTLRMAEEDQPEDPFAGLPGDVGDDREKFVRVTLVSGEQIEHGDVYFRYTDEEFIVAPSMDFEDEEMVRYHKGEAVRVEIIQHHAACFVTTAVAGESETLDTLRRFRDDVLGQTLSGRMLVGLYYAVSPPVADTLERHPESRTATAVRWFVNRCAGLVARRKRHSRLRTPLSVLVTLLYVIGLLVATAGTVLIRVREGVRGRRIEQRSDVG